MRPTKPKSLSKQVKQKVENPVPKETKEYDGDFGTVISTGSTLLDLAISGGRVRGGGIPGGIFVEAFGPSASGKTVLLCEIAGDIQRKGGDTRFDDPESRLNTQFALMFGFSINEKNYATPDTVTQVFKAVKDWKPTPKNPKAVNGIFTDSLAALSTDLEMGEGGDPFGGRRAKEFSEGLRTTCRVIKDKNYLMVCSNQIREVIGAIKFQEKTKSPGGKALEFYPSLRLQFGNPIKITVKKTINAIDQSRVIGVETTVTVYKSSIWKPYRKASVIIIFDYGIDDIRANLQFIKDNSSNSVYTLGGEPLDKSMVKSIYMVEDKGLQSALKEEVIDLWESIEKQFESTRKPKIR